MDRERPERVAARRGRYQQRLSLDAITASVLASVPALPPVDRPIAECLGCVLATPVVAPADVPPWPVATRDGYAVRAADVIAPRSAGAVRLKVVGEARAETLPRSLAAGSALRVMTGAPVPRGADTVVPAEWCRPGSAGATADWVDIVRESEPGQYVAGTGTEFGAGAAALSAGTVLGPPELAVLAALGQGDVRVLPRPRVAIIATGSELSWRAGPSHAGRLYPSNVALVQAMVTACGGAVSAVRVTSDDEHDVAAGLRDALGSDLVLTTGGTGRSSRDVVGTVLLEQETDSLWNAPVRGSKAAPFRLLRHAETGRSVPHLALPGRPIAAMTAFIAFAYPLLRHLAGLPAIPPRHRWARLAGDVAGTPGRHRYIPVRLERRGTVLEAVPAGEASLYGLAATAGTDGFAVVGRRAGWLEKGRRVRVLIPPWCPDKAL